MIEDLKELTKGWTVLQIVAYLFQILVTVIIGTLMLLGIVGGLVFLYERLF